jgi:hypothetical protein
LKEKKQINNKAYREEKRLKIGVARMAAMRKDVCGFLACNN